MSVAVPSPVAVAAEGMVRGYASLFGRLDRSGDIVERGAFARSLREKGAAGIRMLWQHDPAVPIGTWTRIVEDERGLLVEGRLALHSTRGREAFELVRAGAIDGLSIGFRTRKARREAGGARRVLDIDLWEVSVVTFPMQSLARLATRSGRAVAQTLRERLQAAARSMSAPRPRPTA